MKSFLSYPTEQRTVARAIYDFLGSIGIQPWFDQESLVAGQDWNRERKIAQRAADLTFLVLSPETISRAGVIQAEVKEALELLETKPLGDTFLVSLRTHDVTVPPELGKYQYIDFFRAGWQARVARAVTLRLTQLRETDPTPLREFLEAQEKAQGIQFRALRFPKFQADYFVYQQAGEYWEYINAEIVSDIMGGFLNAKGLALSQKPGFPPSYWERQVTEHYRQGDLVSLRITAQQYFGGAYPNHGVYSLNFGGTDIGKVELQDLFGHNPDVLQKLIDRCNKAYRDIGDEQIDSDVIRDDPYRDLWKVVRQWNFNQDGVLISLSEWSDLPHVLGIHEVVVPWSELKAKLAASYRGTPIGQFILSK